MATASLPHPRRTSASDLAARNARIAADRAAGLTWREVAAKHGVSERTARGAAADHRAAAAPAPAATRPPDLDVEADFVAAVDAHRTAMTKLAEVAGKADNSSAAMGAWRAHAATGRSLVELYGVVGMLPDPTAVLLSRAEKQQARARGRVRGEALLMNGARR